MAESNSKITLKIKNSTGVVIMIEIDKTETIDSLKEAIKAK